MFNDVAVSARLPTVLHMHRSFSTHLGKQSKYVCSISVSRSFAFNRVQKKIGGLKSLFVSHPFLECFTLLELIETSSIYWPDKLEPVAASCRQGVVMMFGYWKSKCLWRRGCWGHSSPWHNWGWARWILPKFHLCQVCQGGNNYISLVMRCPTQKQSWTFKMYGW